MHSMLITFSKPSTPPQVLFSFPVSLFILFQITDKCYFHTQTKVN